jgi:hypothetical protein
MRQTQLKVIGLVLIGCASFNRSHFLIKSLLNSYRIGAHCNLVTLDVSALFHARDAFVASAVGDVIAAVGVLWFLAVVMVSTVVDVPAFVVILTVVPFTGVSTSSGVLLLSAFPDVSVLSCAGVNLVALLFLLLLTSQESLLLPLWGM